MVLVSCAGTTAVDGKAFTPVAATALPMRMANLPAMPLKKLLLIVLHAHFLNPQNPDSTEFYTKNSTPKAILFPPDLPSENIGKPGAVNPSSAIDGHNDMIRNNLQPLWDSRRRT